MLEKGIHLSSGQVLAKFLDLRHDLCLIKMDEYR